MTTLKTWYISTYASRREWIKLKVCFFGGSIGKTCVLILSFKAIPENCISLESWKTQLSNDILNEGINLFCGPLRSKIEMTNVIANHFSRCGSRLVAEKFTPLFFSTIDYSLIDLVGKKNCKFLSTLSDVITVESMLLHTFGDQG